MVNEKGLSEESADIIGEYVKLNGELKYMKCISEVVICCMYVPPARLFV